MLSVSSDAGLLLFFKKKKTLLEWNVKRGREGPMRGKERRSVDEFLTLVSGDGRVSWLLLLHFMWSCYIFIYFFKKSSPFSCGWDLLMQCDLFSHKYIVTHLPNSFSLVSYTPLWPTIKTGTLNSFACLHLLTILIACYEKENPDLMCLCPFLAFSGENRGSPIFLFVCSDHSFPNYVLCNTSFFF